MLYLHDILPNASPKAISGRTSYLRVRLAFHLYPQLIARFCNSEAFGLPRGVTLASPWPWVAHSVSGLLLATPALLRLAFAPAPGVLPLNLATKSNSLAHSPRGTRSGISAPSDAVTALPLLVSTRFQVLFHSGYPGSFHLSLTVLVHYRSPRVFSLGEWTPLLPTGLACPVVLKPSAGSRCTFAYGTLTLSGRPSQYLSASASVSYSLDRCSSPDGALFPLYATPANFYTYRVSAFPLSLATTRRMFSFPEGTKMFQFPSFPLCLYVFKTEYPGIPPGGFPHSDTSGSSLADSSPKLFAVNHVLRRLLAPRHPPCALRSLTIVIHTKLS